MLKQKTINNQSKIQNGTLSKKELLLIIFTTFTIFTLTGIAFNNINKNLTSQYTITSNLQEKMKLNIRERATMINGVSYDSYKLGTNITLYYSNTKYGLKVIISAPDILNYTNIKANITIPEKIDIGKANSIKIYWQEEKSYISFNYSDKNNNGKIDYIEWNVEHLSNQTYEIILITMAEHRDENRTFISDIFAEVREIDHNWSETIPDQHFVRVTFERNLTSRNDITIFARVISGTPIINVYEVNESIQLAQFNNIPNNLYQQIFLTNLIGTQDTFDLQIVNGSIEFEHIIDPVPQSVKGTAVWGNATTGLLKAGDLTNIGRFDTQFGSVATSASAIQFARVEASPTRMEKIAAHLKADGRLDVLKCANACVSATDWSLIGTLAGATTSGNSNKRAFDIGYMDSGDFMIVFADDPTANKAYYCTYNGTAWSPSSNCSSTFTPGIGNEILIGGIGVPLWIELKPNRNNQFLMGASGTTGFGVAAWNGTKWIHNTTISTSALAVTTNPAFGLEWESQSNIGMVLFDTTAADGTTFYRNYTISSGWDTSNVAGPDTGAGNNLYINMASDPNSNRISIVMQDSESDTHIYMWKMGGTDTTFSTTSTNPIDASIELGPNVVTAWDYYKSNAIYAYVDLNALYLSFLCWNLSSNFSSVLTTVGGQSTDDIDGVTVDVLKANNLNYMLFLQGDIVDDLKGTVWDITSCTSGGSTFTALAPEPVEGTLSYTTDNGPGLPFDFAYDRFDNSTCDIPLTVGATGWYIDCADNCVISTNENLFNAPLIINGTGNVTITSTIDTIGNITKTGGGTGTSMCTLTLKDNGKLIQRIWS